MAPSILSAKQRADLEAFLEAFLARHPMQDAFDDLYRRCVFEDMQDLVGFGEPDLIEMSFEVAHILTGCTREQWDAVMANAIDLDAEEEA